ncbi:aminotransferase-like domain-containing protein [Nonomuraea sp. KM88]|uniref:aminotransferase-like domain-containing protein n=1 Tax=Nonomuraea sp. KM88 TaxID=3457427 RepID=UPI003FCC5F4B
MNTQKYQRESLESTSRAAVNPSTGQEPGMSPGKVRWPLDLGLPDATTFPRSEFLELTEHTLAEAEPSLFYGGPGRAGIARGHAGLRAALAERIGAAPSSASGIDGIMLTSGAAHAIELVWRALLRDGDVFVVEAPTWGASIRIGRALGAEPLAIPMDRDGMRVDVLERRLGELKAAGRRCKLVYVIADYNTPTGWSLSLSRRRQLLRLAVEYDFLVIEDRVYAELRYDGPQLPPMSTLEGGDRLITVGSFSKTLAPGLRCGWLSASPDLVDVVAAPREDLGSSQLTARILEHFVRSGRYDEHLSRVTRMYRSKRDTVVASLREHCGDTVRFDVPHGGMFVWIELADHVKGDLVMHHSAQEGVLCRPGDSFFGDGGNYQQWFRMAFTMVSEPELVRGVRVLGEAIQRST